MRKPLLFVLTLGVVAAAIAQPNNPSIVVVASSPSGNACVSGVPVQYYSGTYYGCDNTGHYAAISGSTYSLPTASTSVLGGVKVDGTNCVITSQVLTCAGTATGTGYVFVTTMTVVGSTTTTISFTNIAATAKDLDLICTGATDDAGQDIALISAIFNSDTTSGHYIWNWTVNTAGTVTGVAGPGVSLVQFDLGYINAAQTAGTGTIHMLIPQYANSGFTNHPVSSKNVTPRTGAGFSHDMDGIWMVSAAITRIDIVDTLGGHFTAGTVCTLRGLP